MLETIDYMPYRVFAADASYLYCAKSGRPLNQLYRLTDRRDRPSAPIYTFTGNIQLAWASTTTPGLVFVLETILATNTYKLYKSVNYGQAFGNNSPAFDNAQPVALVGDVDGTTTNQLHGVAILSRGLCIVGTTIYFGEYSVAPGRIPGGTNDQVRIKKSTDNGTTWTTYAEWNTDGTHYVRHVHAVQHDNGYLYIQIGDSTLESGFLRVQEGQPLASNQPLTAYSAVYTGSQRYRTGDIIFPPGAYMYWMADSDLGEADRGVWQAKKDMSDTPVRVSSHITAYQNHSGWYGVVLPSGGIVFSTFVEAGAPDLKIKFFGSKDKATWGVVGTYALSAGNIGGALEFMGRGGEFYFSKTGGAGKADAIGTVVLAETSAAVKNRVLHPVHWVSKTGKDSTDGYRGNSSVRPWRSLGYALTGDRITYGARIILADGQYQEPGVTPKFDANATPATATDSVTIDAAGTGAEAVLTPPAVRIAEPAGVMSVEVAPEVKVSSGTVKSSRSSQVRYVATLE